MAEPKVMVNGQYQMCFEEVLLPYERVLGQTHPHIRGTLDFYYNQSSGRTGLCIHPPLFQVRGYPAWRMQGKPENLSEHTGEKEQRMAEIGVARWGRTRAK